MKAVFVHDHKFRKVEGKIYSPGGLSNEILSRYTQWFDEIIVVGRIIQEDHTPSTYSKIDNPNIFVVTNTDLFKLVKETDSVIIRLPSINGYKAISYAKKYKKPYLVEVVGCTFDAYWNYGLKGKLFAIPAYFIMRYYVKNAPYALYVTSKFLQKRYPCSGKTIDVSDVAIESTKEDILENRLKKIGKNDTILVLGTAGAIDVAYKGQEYVIRALPELIKLTGKDIRYELAGAGNPQKLRNIAEECGVSERVIFKGTIKHDEIFKWFDLIDIYIQSSMLEGLSRAIIEAMSRGLPCVAANKGGNPELIEKEYLFSTIARKMIPQEIGRCIINVKKDMKRIARRNFEFANNNYNLDELTQKRDVFYKDFAHS